MPDQITTIYQLFEKFSWGNLLEINEAQNFVKIANTEDFLIKKERDFLKISFYDFNKETRIVEKRKDYIEIFIHKDLDPIKFINYWSNDEKDSHGYNFLREYWVFKRVFEKINIIKISETYKKDLQVKSKELFLKPEKIKEIFKVIEDINKKANSSKSSLVNYLVNQSKFDFLNKTTKKTTSITKGDFNFLVHRLNLTTKKSKKDFQTYLNENDISSLGMLFDKMIRKEVFDEEYLRKLDDYFIKEKLEDIISIGKQILSLKVESVETQDAKKLIKKIFGEEI